MTHKLPNPDEVLYRLTFNERILLANEQGFEIVAARNGYKSGFAIKVLAQDLQGLGTLTDYAVGGFKTRPSVADYKEVFGNAVDYIKRNTSDEIPEHQRLRPYVAPQPAQFFAEDDLELFMKLVRDSAPIDWQNLSVDRLAAIPSYTALLPGGQAMLARLQTLEAETGAVKLWPTERDGYMLGITGAGRAYVASQIC